MRYRVLDLPGKGVGAFTPLPTTNPIASSWGLVRVSGSPGTLAIPAPSPEKSWAPIPGGGSGPLAQYQSSNVAPDVRTPDIYIAHADHMGPSADAGFGMATRRHTPIPVPARSWINTAKQAMITPRLGGRSVATQPRAFQRFPTIGG